MRKIALVTMFAVLALGAGTAGAQSYGGSGGANGNAGNGQLGSVRSTKMRAPSANDLSRANQLSTQVERRRTPKKQAPSGWARGSN